METNVEQNLCSVHTHHKSLMHQHVGVEDAPEMAHILGTERENVERIIGEEQVHKVQVAALSEMQLQVIQQVEEQEKELQRLNALLVEHQVILETLSERPHHELLQAPPERLGQLRHNAFDYLPSPVNATRGKVSDLNGPPIIKNDTFEDTLVNAEVLDSIFQHGYIYTIHVGKTHMSSHGTDPTSRNLTGS